MGGKKRPKGKKKAKEGKQSHHKRISQSLMDKQIVQLSMNGGISISLLTIKAQEEKRPKRENKVINEWGNSIFLLTIKALKEIKGQKGKKGQKREKKKKKKKKS